MKYDLSCPQNSIYLTEKFYNGTSVNNICGYVHISDNVDFDVLRKAINLLVKTNDGMRLKIIEENGSCKQYVSSFQEFSINTLELFPEKDTKDYKELIEKKALEFANIPIDINNNLLFKFILFKLPNGSGGFIVNVHHLIGDSWSLGLIAKEVTNIYSNLLTNTYVEENFPSYTNYIESETNYINSDKYKKDKEFWDEAFKTVPEVASIPSGKSVSSTSNMSPVGGRKKFSLNEDTLNLIKDFCTKNKISVYNFFMAVLSLYLGRVSNLDEFIIGTPILNRTNFEQKHTIGMFINTAPLKILLNQELSFEDFCRQLGADTMAVFRHQRYSYNTILEDLRKRDSSIPNLYNVVLSYQITKTIENDSNINYSTDWIFNGNCADELQMHLFDLNDENKLTIAYDYKTDKYDEQDIIDLHARLLTIISQVIDNSNILLKNIEIVTPEEKHKILYEFNNTKADYPHDKTIVDLFEEQVEKTPDNIAVVFEDQKLTYRELNEKANQLARYLQNMGIKTGDIIAILFLRSLEMIVSILGVLKAGAAYLPLDPNYPEERLKYILKDCNLKCLLTNDTSKEHYHKNTIFFDSPTALFKNYDKVNLKINIPNESPSYLIYTSGSTGTPKGVVLKHLSLTNLANYCNETVQYLKNNEYISIASITTISFDIFIFETLISLQKGLKVIIANENEQTLPIALNNLIKKENIEVIQTTPSRMQIFYNNIDTLNNLKKIKYFILAGEPLSIELCRNLHSISGATIYNGYGPSETTVFATLTDVTNKSDQMTIGHPLFNSHIYILDKNMHLCPIGVQGEICIAGNDVGLGYINNPNLTKNSFVQNPFVQSETMYHSGDIGFYTNKGEIICLGRIDHQIKIRGLRVELQEIEDIILRTPNINNCIVYKVTNLSGNDSLCAYFTKTGPISIASLKNVLYSKLPNYMVPEFFIELKSFPYTPNGKIDKKRLPQPTFETNTVFVKPRNSIDIFIIQTLIKLLKINNISLLDSFYSLGGDSLTAISLSTSILKNFGISISIQEIFKHPIIQDLSDYISSLTKTKNSYIIPKHKSSEDYYLLSSAQKRIYYASNLDSNSILYNTAGGVIIDKLLDTNKLQKCFETLIQRHEILRTHFNIKNNEIVQIINNNVDFKLEIEDTDEIDINKIYTNFVKPFDLSKAPLFRAKFVKLENNKTLLLLDMHHIISDGTSLGILLQELCDLYNGNSLAEKSIDYKDFSVWEAEQFKAEEFNKSKEYWLNQFKDNIPILNMPTNNPRPSSHSFDGSNYYTKLSAEIFEKINNVSKELNITPYMLLLSCFYMLLSKYSSQDDIVVGTPIVGRELPELSNVLGMFVNTLALRNNINSNLTFVDFTKVIKENCLNAFKYQAYPFDMLVKDLNLKRDTSRNPLFDVMFVYQNEGLPKVNFNNAKVEYYIPDNHTSKFDLTLEIIPTDDEYSMRFEYCTKLFNKSFIERLSSHYINILNAILSHPEIKIADAEMISEEEKNQILYEFNNTKTEYPRDKTIIELFEEQVEKTPDSIAVVFEDQKLTYKELNEKANQLARFLITNGASPGDIIGILLDKSLEVIISLLGILKVGGTFLPIDISYPNERINYILQDSKADMLLTNHLLIHKANDTVKSLIVESESSYFSEYEKDNLNISYLPENLAYIMYTSGSTGNPKGVMVTHQNVVRLVKNNTFIEFDKDEHILQTGSIVFDACTFEIWGALLNGFKLFVMKKENLLDAYLLEKYLDKNKISTLWLTAPLFNQLSETNPLMFKNVKKLLTGGDVLSPKHINMVKRNCPNLTIINGYGPTENTTFSCCFTINKKYTNSIPIGKPISNSTAYVISNNNKLCPIGIPGELWVGGDGVSKGYLNNDNLTAEKFIDNPFGEGRIYKTGDLVKWLPDGNIEFIGRIDNQVKLRGFRVELSEINNRILENPEVKEAFTTIKLVNNVKNICSYVVTKNNFNLNDLKLYLNNYLPEYMIPSYFIKLKKLPINPNGKVDKSALPNDFECFIDTRILKEASTEEERLLLSLFKKVLNNDNIGTTDSFFEVGGDSLTAMKLQVEAMSYNLNISYADIFKYATVESLIINLHKRQSNTNSDYDSSYDKYNTLLKNNTLSKDIECLNSEVGNVLLTGVTGFLGAHILDSFIKKETGKIYCLIRSKNNMSSRERLFNVLHFYFEDKYDILVDDRIIPVEGDITFDNLGLSYKDYKNLGNTVNTIIHSAALVKHYGIYRTFEDINVNGTKRIVDFATKFNLKLLHVSTISVSGNNLAEGSNIDNHFGKEIDYDETCFYIGQNLDNLYVKSKFEAEKIVLDSIQNGLSACVLRMGNLTSRFSEGKFQQNHFENAFVNRLKSFLQIGVFPKSLLNLYCEFTPIDYSGDAIINIANHFNKKYTVFHLLNEKHVELNRFFDILKEIGIDIKLVSDNEFSKEIQNILENPEKRQYIEGIINDLTSDKKLIYKSEVNIKSDFTKEFLYKTGFEWPYIDVHYIRNYFKYLMDIGYFNIKID